MDEPSNKPVSSYESLVYQNMIVFANNILYYAKKGAGGRLSTQDVVHMKSDMNSLHLAMQLHDEALVHSAATSASGATSTAAMPMPLPMQHSGGATTAPSSPPPSSHSYLHHQHHQQHPHIPTPRHLAVSSSSTHHLAPSPMAGSGYHHSHHTNSPVTSSPEQSHYPSPHASVNNSSHKSGSVDFGGHHHPSASSVQHHHHSAPSSRDYPSSSSHPSSSSGHLPSHSVSHPSANVRSFIPEPTSRSDAARANQQIVKKPKQKRSSRSHAEKRQECLCCKTTDTPIWRKGPHGPATLCNACGLKYMRANKSRKKAQDSTGSSDQQEPLSTQSYMRKGARKNLSSHDEILGATQKLLMLQSSPHHHPNHQYHNAGLNLTEDARTQQQQNFFLANLHHQFQAKRGSEHHRSSPASSPPGSPAALVIASPSSSSATPSRSPSPSPLDDEVLQQGEIASAPHSPLSSPQLLESILNRSTIYSILN